MQEHMLQPITPHRETSRGITIALALLAVLIVLGGTGIGFYTTVLHVKELHTQANAVVQDLLSAQAQATRVASPQYIYTQITSKKPTLDDPLDNQHGSWTTRDDQPGNSCAFTDGAYHIHLTTSTRLLCSAEGSTYRNFIFQAQITFMKGTIGGLLFRSPMQDNSYSFGLTSDGQYILDVGKSGNDQTLAFGRSSTANTGLNRPNLLTVLARDNTISLYVNKQFVKSIHDDTFQSGSIGFFAISPIGTGADVAFSNAQLWIL